MGRVSVEDPALIRWVMLRLDATRMDVARDVAADAWVSWICVPDMVPPLREFRLRWPGKRVRDDVVRLLNVTLGEVAHVVDLERDIRRWAAVDP